MSEREADNWRQDCLQIIYHSAWTGTLFVPPGHPYPGGRHMCLTRQVLVQNTHPDFFFALFTPANFTFRRTRAPRTAPTSDPAFQFALESRAGVNSTCRHKERFLRSRIASLFCFHPKKQLDRRIEERRAGECQEERREERRRGRGEGRRG